MKQQMVELGQDKKVIELIRLETQRSVEFQIEQISKIIRERRELPRAAEPVFSQFERALKRPIQLPDQRDLETLYLGLYFLWI
jgi:hypothetical protein